MKVFVINQEQLVRYGLLTLAAVVLSFMLGFLSALQLATPQPSEVSVLKLSEEAEQTDEASADSPADSLDSTQPSEADSAEDSTDATTAAEAEKKSQPEVKTEQKIVRAKAEARPEPEPEPAPVAAKAEPPATSSASAETTSAQQSASSSNQRVYSIQAGMFASKTNAQSFIEKLSEKDFAAYVAEFVSSDGAVKYNVRVGHFASREQARDRLKQYQQLFSTPAYVVIAQ